MDREEKYVCVVVVCAWAGRGDSFIRGAIVFDARRRDFVQSITLGSMSSSCENT